MYPQSVEGEESRPPYGGIGIGVSDASDEKELALEAAECPVSPENRGVNAELTGNMPASAAGYEYPRPCRPLRARTAAAVPGTASMRPPRGR
ncbi:hypothetical protein [Nocardioides sp. B-3]|uniref:hypothetical protein n=1 Tax=Nocardioides sp. B-3 TaxID=2895565 RepID=UPI002152F36B|nr:hypothetical protein [Nocardioides sp. B-3]UUZ60250.1 hypothetical protein LP418_04770 [Nocardioides sp. B-3]